MTTPRVKVGLIGFGYWGPNLLRNLVQNPGCDVVGVVDNRSAARKKCESLYPHIKTHDTLDAWLAAAGGASKPDAMVIAAPPAAHCALAVQCLNAGMHVLVEKPLAVSARECDQILEAGRRAGKRVMVDHTFAYNPAVEDLTRRIRSGDLGDLLYYDSVRANLGGFQPKTNVLWDLAPHDLSILDAFTGGRSPTQVTALGVKHFDSTIETLCYMSLKYDDAFIAHLHLNWAAPVKIRTVIVGGSKKMAIYDDGLASEKIKIYDKSVSLQGATELDFRVSYRVGDMIAPAISHREPLDAMVTEFLRAIQTGDEARTSGESGRRIVRILEAASRSMAGGGAPIAV